jgi:hypothetical protein
VKRTCKVCREKELLSNVCGFELTFQISLFNNIINTCGIERCKSVVINGKCAVLTTSGVRYKLDAFVLIYKKKKFYKLWKSAASERSLRCSVGYILFACLFWKRSRIRKTILAKISVKHNITIFCNYCNSNVYQVIKTISYACILKNAKSVSNFNYFNWTQV